MTRLSDADLTLKEDATSHLGRTCSLAGQKHLWSPSAPGTDICLECKLTRPNYESVVAECRQRGEELAAMTERAEKAKRMLAEAEQIIRRAYPSSPVTDNDIRWADSILAERHKARQEQKG